MLSNDDLGELESAHTKTDLETVCWEAAKEIKWLRLRCKHFEMGLDALLLDKWRSEEQIYDQLYDLLQKAPQDPSEPVH